MEANEKNDAPVLNTEELSAGSSLVEGLNETNEKTNTTPEKDEMQIDSFDPKAFAAKENVSDSNNGNNTTNSSNNADDDSFGLSWPDLDDSSSNSGNETPTAKDNNVTEDKKGDNNKPALNQEAFKTFAAELGLEADNIDEIKETFQRLVEENIKLKENSKEPISNKKIDDLNKFLKLDDETLVRKSFEADGLTGEKLDYAVDRLTDTGLIDVEALKIRNNIDRAIKAESQNVIKAKEAEIAKQEESREQAVKSFSDYMQRTDSLYGFKLTGNPDKLPDVRKNHIEYVTSGRYLAEISANEQTLAESSWLWRNRETLKNALINNGRQNGRKEILDRIGYPDRSIPQRFTNPIDTGEFDPKKFLQG